MAWGRDAEFTQRSWGGSQRSVATLKARFNRMLASKFPYSGCCGPTISLRAKMGGNGAEADSSLFFPTEQIEESSV